jgi:hypothetical protein
MASGFFRGDAYSQSQTVQKVFSILLYSPVFGRRNHNRGNRSETLHDLLRFFEAPPVGQA